jgi:hypothetical protein
VAFLLDEFADCLPSAAGSFARQALRIYGCPYVFF